jgi:hypothetical protein
MLIHSLYPFSFANGTFHGMMPELWTNWLEIGCYN